MINFHSSSQFQVDHQRAGKYNPEHAPPFWSFILVNCKILLSQYYVPFPAQLRIANFERPSVQPRSPPSYDFQPVSECQSAGLLSMVLYSNSLTYLLFNVFGLSIHITQDTLRNHFRDSSTRIQYFHLEAFHAGSFSHFYLRHSPFRYVFIGNGE